MRSKEEGEGFDISTTQPGRMSSYIFGFTTPMGSDFFSSY